MLDRTLASLSSGRKPTNGPKLCEVVLSKWSKGTLNYCVQRRDFPSAWLPPAMSDDEVVSTTKRVGFPLTDSQIIRLNRWKFAIQLMAVYGLRPEDLRELYTKQNGKEIWTDYRKSKGGRKGETTEPRELFPLWVLDSDGTAVDESQTCSRRIAPTFRTNR